FAALSPGTGLTSSRARQEVTFWSAWATSLARWTPDVLSLAGWSLSLHHFYDARGQVLYLGDGTRRTTSTLIITTIAGGGNSLPDGVPAIQAQLLSPHAVATGADGSVYVVDGLSRIYRIDPSGMISTFAQLPGGFYQN